LDLKELCNPAELLQTKEERFAKIGKEGVDFLLQVAFTKEFASIGPKEFLDILKEKVNIKFLLLGYDNSFGNPKSGDFRDLISKGEYSDVKIIRDGSAMYEQDTEISSTEIRKAIRQGNISLANRMLEEEYSLQSFVEKGLQIGHSLGFPTANIHWEGRKILPKKGVYATRVLFEGKIYKSVTNIGNRPTFQGGKSTVETFIFDFDKDIYGREIRLYFVDYLREEQRFETKELLVAQMKKDCQNAKEILS
ncbi:MAG: riboflavin biosynthesis protein RibF, partial [Bacteroidales bacterium]|nr:riboflavin biosynthesis protein RibF [Bacteroidales bacterium]